MMGRVVREGSVPLSDTARTQLALGAAARAAQLDETDLPRGWAQLLALLPGMGPRLLMLRPNLLGALCADPQAVAQRMIQLRQLFPGANLSEVVSKRPSLLLDPEFLQVPEARRKLLVLFTEAAVVDRLVSAQPLLLTEDVDAVVAELQRLMPGCNVALVLSRNPNLLFSVQRGQTSLGPGAEFMGPG